MTKTFTSKLFLFLFMISFSILFLEAALRIFFGFGKLPVFIEEKNGKKILRGHIMKNNDHHKAFLNNPHVLVVFSGHHTYVSGTWYSNPHTPSTWNYMSVHAKGIIRYLDDEGLIDALRMTSLHFENNNPQSTTIYDNLPSDYTKKLMKAIVAFEIEIIELDTVFKCCSISCLSSSEAGSSIKPSIDFILVACDLKLCDTI